MMRRCDGTDPNLGRPGHPCDCGLTFDDVERSVIYPHDPVGARLTVGAGNEVWWWSAPREGETVPDRPPVLLGTLGDDVQFDIPVTPDDDVGGTDAAP